MSYDSFNPSYWTHFFKQVVLSPLLLLLAAGWIHLRSQKIAACLSRVCDDASD